MRRWFMVCRMVGSTFFTMFSSWWGSDVRLYISTNDWRNNRKHTHWASTLIFFCNNQKRKPQISPRGKFPPQSCSVSKWLTPTSSGMRAFRSHVYGSLTFSGSRKLSCVVCYLAVCKLAVLKVLIFIQGPDTGVCVVVGVLTNTVWVTNLHRWRVELVKQLQSSNCLI